jgi:hypothetical protein
MKMPRGFMTLTEGSGRAEVRFRKEDFPLKNYTAEHDPMHVRVLILKAEEDFLLLSLEMTSLPSAAIAHYRSMASRLTGIDEAHVHISVTHSFSSPHFPARISSPAEEKLNDVLYRRIDEAAELACRQASDLKPCRISYGTAECPVNINRNVETPEGWWLGRNPEGYSSHTLHVLRFTREDQTDELLSIDLQSSLMNGLPEAEDRFLLSSDIAGAACSVREKEIHTAVFLPGAAGDQAPVRAASSLSEAERYLEEYGRLISQAAASAFMHETGTDIHQLHHDIDLPEQIMRYPTKELTPHRTFDFAFSGGTVTVPVTLIRIGEASLLLTSPELNSSYGRKIRDLMGTYSMIGTLCDGACKYLPEQEDYQKITYTAMNAMLGQGSAEQFYQAVQHITEEL